MGCGAEAARRLGHRARSGVQLQVALELRSGSEVSRQHRGARVKRARLCSGRAKKIRILNLFGVHGLLCNMPQDG